MMAVGLGLSRQRRPLLPLDGFGGSGLYAAFGVRRLLSGYGGPLMRVRRTSDNAEADIYPGGGGWLDSAALAAFAGAGSAFVVQWHDQTGNGRAATQATAGAQPRIVNAGVIDAGANGRPALYFDGSNDTLAIQSSLDFSRNASSLTVGVVADGSAVGSELFVFSSRSDSGNPRFGLSINETAANATCRRWSSDSPTKVSMTKSAAMASYIAMARYAAGQVDVAVNSAAASAALPYSQVTADLASISLATVGSHGGSSNFFLGKIGAVVLARAALDIASLDAALLQVMP